MTGLAILAAMIGIPLAINWALKRRGFGSSGGDSDGGFVDFSSGDGGGGDSGGGGD